MLPTWSHRKFMRKPNMLWSYCCGGVSQQARFTRGSSANTAERLPFRPVPTGSRVVSGAPRSCQNAHDITHIINNYRLSTDGRADGHTATEICLISARPFPDIFSRAHSCCLPGGKILMKKTKCLWKKNENPIGGFVAFPPLQEEKKNFLVMLIWGQICFLYFCTWLWTSVFWESLTVMRYFELNRWLWLMTYST